MHVEGSCLVPFCFHRFQHHIMNYFGPTILFLSFDQFVYAVAVDLPWTCVGVSLVRSIVFAFVNG